MRVMWVAVVLIVGVLIGAPIAHAQKRVALVIGNGAYTKVPRLDNPRNDAAAMEAMFKTSGFNPVVRANDLGVAAMRRALRDFSDTAQDADVAVIFYAGHGIEVAGINYLIPTDAVLKRDIDAQDEAISLDRLSQILEPVKRLRLVILDACRDNPFARSMRRTIPTRSVRSGYGDIDERSLPPNTLVAYAQRAGATAEDGVGSKNSPYTTALLKHLPTPGLDVELALRRVRDEVLRSTNNRQEPFKYGSLGGSEIALVTKPQEPTQKIEQIPISPLAQAAAEWDTLRSKNDLIELEAFAQRHKGTYFADLAKTRIDHLKRTQTISKSYTFKSDDQKRAEADAARKKAEDNARDNKAAEPAQQKTALVETPRPQQISPTRASKPLTAEEERSLKPKDTFKECDECPEMVVVPAGTFKMGDTASNSLMDANALPHQQVSIPKPLAVGRFEVTHSQWNACVKAGGCKTGDRLPNTWWTFGWDNYPVANVSWRDTKDYIAWLSSQTRKKYRLLSEAEWEYVARAGSSTEYAWGNTPGRNLANCKDCGSAWDDRQPAPVGSFNANAFNASDMQGNVWEWVEDCYHHNYAKMERSTLTTGAPWVEGCNVTMKVVRGGAYDSDKGFGLRVSVRRSQKDNEAAPNLGFRVVRTLD